MGLPYQWRGMGFSAFAPESPKFAFDFNGNMHGTPSPDTLPGLKKHVASAQQVSDIIVRHNLMK